MQYDASHIYVPYKVYVMGIPQGTNDAYGVATFEKYFYLGNSFKLMACFFVYIF